MLLQKIAARARHNRFKAVYHRSFRGRWSRLAQPTNVQIVFLLFIRKQRNSERLQFKRLPGLAHVRRNSIGNPLHY